MPSNRPRYSPVATPTSSPGTVPVYNPYLETYTGGRRPSTQSEYSPSDWQYWWDAPVSSPTSIRDTGNTRNPRIPDGSSPNTDEAMRFADIYRQALQAYDPAAIAKVYAQAYGQMGRAQGAAVANSQRTAALQAAAGSAANSGSFVLGAGQQARAPYASALGELTLKESQTQLGAKEKIKDTLYLLDRAHTGDEKDQAELELRRQQLQLERQRLQAQLDANEAGPLDYLGMIAGAFSPAVPYLMFPSLVNSLSNRK